MFMLGNVWRLSLVVITFAAACTECYAGLITAISPTVTAQTNGSFTYEYELANSSSSDIPVLSLTVDIAPQANLMWVAGPANWSVIYTPGDKQISWVAGNPTAEVQPGTSESFQFSSAVKPGAAVYSIVGFDANSVTFGFNQGVTISPNPAAATPEPAGMALAGLGVVLLCVYRRLGQRLSPPLKVSRSLSRSQA
jgi:hypothetical protein